MLISKDKKIAFIKFLRANLVTEDGKKPTLASAKYATDCLWRDLFGASDTFTPKEFTTSYKEHMDGTWNAVDHYHNTIEKTNAHK